METPKDIGMGQHGILPANMEEMNALVIWLKYVPSKNTIFTLRLYLSFSVYRITMMISTKEALNAPLT